MPKNSGFTLIELIIALAIIGILAAIAIPSYQNIVMKAHRQAAIADLLQIQLLEERYRASKSTYTTSLVDLTAPDTNAYYRYSIPEASSSYFLIQADAIEGGKQLNDRQDGVSCKQLTLDQKGSKKPAECWE